jgi:DNA-binding NarL/FixJ family response regulator
MSLQAAIWAVNLVRAGGTYIPASTLVTRQEDDDPYPDRAARTFKTLTAREFEILDALGRGKANKQIAYELDLAEGTVKVHLSKIMKKTKARNRTEVALMASKRPKS